VPLPGRAVKVGDSWEGRLTFWPDPLMGTMASDGGMMGEGMGMGMGMDMMDPMLMAPGMDMGMEGGMGEAASTETKPPTTLETRTVQATHTIAGFEWVMGYPTVRIRSTYSVDDDKVTIPSASAGAVGGEGMEFGGPMGEPGMMPGGAFGDMGMGGGEAGMAGGAQGAEKDTSYVGERITYWSWDLHRPLRLVDTVTHTLEIDRAAQMSEMGMGGEMGGMGMEGVMPPGMDPGMDPGMFEPGMDPGMMPGGMGEFGMGAQMQPPAEPMKVVIRVGLTIQEVGL